MCWLCAAVRATLPRTYGTDKPSTLTILAQAHNYQSNGLPITIPRIRKNHHYTLRYTGVFAWHAGPKKLPSQKHMTLMSSGQPKQDCILLGKYQFRLQKGLLHQSFMFKSWDHALPVARALP